MGKKQALGSTPTFENVSKATMKNDLFTEEEIKEAQEKTLEANKEEPSEETTIETITETFNKSINEAVEDLKQKVEEPKEEIDLYNSPLLRERIAKAREEKIKNYKPLDPQEQIKQYKKQLERKIEAERRIEEKEEQETLEEPRNYSKPSNKQRLANGYIRATFEVNERQLELIKALTTFQNIKQKDLLEALIERGLADISEDIKESALRYYKHNEEPKKDNVKDLFN